MQHFFRDLNDKESTLGQWYSGIKHNMARMITQRKLLAGETLDQSANELFLVHIKRMSAAFALANTAEAAARKLAVKTCWRASGRAGEPAALTYKGLSWNALFETATQESIQSKPSKLKYVMYPPGRDRHSEWVLDFGDNMAFESRKSGDSDNHPNMSFRDDESQWLLPCLQGGNSGTKLSNYIKGLQAGPEGMTSYAKVAIPSGTRESLPPNPTAAGIRPGAADTLAIAVPAELAVHNTGHDLTGLSALWEYLRAKIALLLPGAVVLAGWDSFPYGQIGKGPVHPSLSSILGVSMAEFDKMIDVLFNFDDSTLKKLRIGGELRPLMHVTLATMIMYYEERFEAKEMHQVLGFMRDAYFAIAAPGANSHFKLIEWARAIRFQFDVDNLHLTSRLGAHGLDQMIHNIKQLASAVAANHAQIAEVASSQRRIEHKVDSLIILVQQRSGASASGAGAAGVGAGASGAGDQPSPAARVVAAIPVVPPALGESPALGQSSAVSAAASSACAASAAASSSSAHEALAAAAQGLPPPSSVNKLDKDVYSLAKLHAGQFYLDCTELGNRLPGGLLLEDKKGKRKADGNKVLQVFNAMADASEQRILTSKTRDSQEANRIVKKLGQLILKRILEEYTARSIPTPPQLAAGSLYFNTAVTNLVASKLPVESSAFAAWRSTGASGAGASGAGSSAGTSGPSSNALGKRPVAAPLVSPRLAKVANVGYKEAAGSGSESEDGSERAPASGGNADDAISLGGDSSEEDSASEDAEEDEEGGSEEGGSDDDEPL